MRKKFILCLSLMIYLLASLVANAYAFSAETDEPMTPIFEKNVGDYYNYAPCMIETDEHTRYVYYCSNRVSGEIVDYICWRKGTLENGVWIYGDENVAFGPSQSDWDQCHVCDPDIIKGKFAYNGHIYTWAMTYLGVAQWDCNANQIGIAFADSIEGPWVKFTQNPIIDAPNTSSWGVGQDSMISLDQSGCIRIIYRYSDGTDDYCRYQDFDFSDINSYTAAPAITVTRQGLTDGVSHTCSSHVIYDSVRETYFMAAEHIWDEQKRSCREAMIASLSKSDFESGTGCWNILYKYNQSNTVYVSNHNVAFCRDPYGYNISPSRLTVVMSSGGADGLWTFKINEGTIKLVDDQNPTTFSTNHAYKLINKANGLVLDNWNSENGSSCYAYEWTGVHNQQWIFTKTGINDYKLINRWTGKALDNYENSSPEITYVWDDVASRDQRWEICQTDSQYCYIKNIETGRALTATENENGSSITATNYEGLDIQKWKIVDCGKAELSASVIEPGHNYKIINRYTGDVLDNWNLENGSICYSYIWTGVNNQKWKVSALNDEGVYNIENQRSGRVLDCYGAENNSDVYIWDNASASDQHWKIESLNNGYFKIVNCKSNLALTQSKSATTSSTGGLL